MSSEVDFCAYIREHGTIPPWVASKLVIDQDAIYNKKWRDLSWYEFKIRRSPCRLICGEKFVILNEPYFRAIMLVPTVCEFIETQYKCANINVFLRSHNPRGIGFAVPDDKIDEILALSDRFMRADRLPRSVFRTEVAYVFGIEGIFTRGKSALIVMRDHTLVFIDDICRIVGTVGNMPCVDVGRENEAVHLSPTSITVWNHNHIIHRTAIDGGWNYVNLSFDELKMLAKSGEKVNFFARSEVSQYAKNISLD